MEIAFFSIILVTILFYIFRPITKIEEKNFKNKSNWRGGF